MISVDAGAGEGMSRGHAGITEDTVDQQKITTKNCYVPVIIHVHLRN
jgi:hypothetical protein